MPCNDIRDRWDSEHNNVAAQLLCAVLPHLPLDNPAWTAELRQWWIDHQNRDAYYKRKSEESRQESIERWKVR